MKTIFSDNAFWIAIISAILGAAIGQYLNRNKEKTQLAFDMHRELNNAEMSAIRQSALEFIKKYPTVSFSQLSTTDSVNSIPVFVLLRFFQRLSQALKYNQIKRSLMVGLFSEIFYYWYFMSYEKNLVNLDWEASQQVQFLEKWFRKSMSESQIERLENKVKSYYSEILNQPLVN